MKVVKVEILPMNAGEIVTATIKVEGGKAEGYESSVESGTPQASQTIILQEDQRVVIDGKVEDEMQYDLEQRAAKKVPLGEKAEAQQKKAEGEKEKFDKMQKEEAERLEKEMPEEMKLRAAQEKARDEKIMGKQDMKAHEAPVKADRGTQNPSTMTLGMPLESNSKPTKEEGSHKSRTLSYG